jgi:hypothetical protein
MWQVVLDTGKQLLISESELLNSKRWFVKKAFNNLNRLQKNKQDQKSIPQRKLEQAELENSLANKSRQERRQNYCEEFKLMMQMIISACKQEGSDFAFEDYSTMIEQMRAPFKMEIEGEIVSVTENKKDNLEEEQNNTNKKACTNTATVPTGRGQNGFGATQFTNGWDMRQNREACYKKIASLKAEAKTISKTLLMIVERKMRCETEWAK